MKARGFALVVALAAAVGLVPALSNAVGPDYITVGQGAIRDAVRADLYRQVTLLATTQPEGGFGYVEIDGKRFFLDCVAIGDVTGGHQLLASTHVKNGKYWSIVLWDSISGKDYGSVLRSSADLGGACRSGRTLPFTWDDRAAFRIFGSPFRTRAYPHVDLSP